MVVQSVNIYHVAFTDYVIKMRTCFLNSIKVYQILILKRCKNTSKNIKTSNKSRNKLFNRSILINLIWLIRVLEEIRPITKALVSHGHLIVYNKIWLHKSICKNSYHIYSTCMKNLSRRRFIAIKKLNSWIHLCFRAILRQCEFTLSSL